MKKLVKKIPEYSAELVTLGGYGRLKKAQIEYDQKHKIYMETYNELDDINNSINQKSESIGYEIKNTRIIINRSAKTLNYLDTSNVSGSRKYYLKYKLENNRSNVLQGILINNNNNIIVTEIILSEYYSNSNFKNSSHSE